MTEELKKIESYIGTEALNRAIEVLGIIGKELPERLDLYTTENWYLGYQVDYSILDSSNNHYAVLLTGDGKNHEYAKNQELDKLGFFEFGKGFLQLAFVKDGIFYQWKRDNKEESLEISVGDRYNITEQTHFIFGERNDGIQTSNITVFGPNSMPPEINSYIEDVQTTDLTPKTGKVVNIQDYFKYFKSLLNQPHYSYVALPRSLRKPEFKKLIARVFERPITTLVDNILTNDQTWRFEKEKENIIRQCETDKRRSRRQRIKDIKTKTERVIDDHKFNTYITSNDEYWAVYNADPSDKEAVKRHYESEKRALRREKAKLIEIATEQANNDHSFRNFTANEVRNAQLHEIDLMETRYRAGRALSLEKRGEETWMN